MLCMLPEDQRILDRLTLQVARERRDANLDRYEPSNILRNFVGWRHVPTTIKTASKVFAHCSILKRKSNGEGLSDGPPVRTKLVYSIVGRQSELTCYIDWRRGRCCCGASRSRARHRTSLAKIVPQADSEPTRPIMTLAGNIDGCMNLYYGLASCLGPAPATKLVQNPRNGRWESWADSCSVIRLMAAQPPMADFLSR